MSGNLGRRGEGPLSRAGFTPDHTLEGRARAKQVNCVPSGRARILVIVVAVSRQTREKLHLAREAGGAGCQQHHVHQENEPDRRVHGDHELGALRHL